MWCYFTQLDSIDSFDWHRFCESGSAYVFCTTIPNRKAESTHQWIIGVVGHVWQLFNWPQKEWLIYNYISLKEFLAIPNRTKKSIENDTIMCTCYFLDSCVAQPISSYSRDTSIGELRKATPKKKDKRRMFRLIRNYQKKYCTHNNRIKKRGKSSRNRNDAAQFAVWRL